MSFKRLFGKSKTKYPCMNSCVCVSPKTAPFTEVWMPKNVIPI